MPAGAGPCWRSSPTAPAGAIPGPASIGVVFRLKDGEELAEHSEAIGRATNNVAEYRAVVAALEHCRRWGVKRVHLNMDSELIVRQLHGTYRVKSPDLRPLYQQVVFLSQGLDEFRVRHIKRAPERPRRRSGQPGPGLPCSLTGLASRLATNSCDKTPESGLS